MFMLAGDPLFDMSPIHPGKVLRQMMEAKGWNPGGILAGFAFYAGVQLASAVVFGILGWSSKPAMRIANLGYFVAVYIWTKALLPNGSIPERMPRERVVLIINRMKDLLNG